MKAVRICAALALASGALHSAEGKLPYGKSLRQENADGSGEEEKVTITELIDITGAEDNCVKEINAWRQKLHPDFQGYELLTTKEEGGNGGDPSTGEDGSGGDVEGGGEEEPGKEPGTGTEEPGNGEEEPTVPEGDTDQTPTEPQGETGEEEPAARSKRQEEQTKNPSATDLAEFFKDKTCETLKSGKFQHIHTKGEEKLFVFSVSVPEAEAKARSELTCPDMMKQIETGFALFPPEGPPAFKDNADLYENPNAVSFVSMLADHKQSIFCGYPKECTAKDTVVCYIKPSFIEENVKPVDNFSWHLAEEYFGVKPVLKPLGDTSYLDAVNAVREKKGLELPKFTEMETEFSKDEQKPGEPEGPKVPESPEVPVARAANKGAAKKVFAAAQEQVEESPDEEPYVQGLLDLTCEAIDKGLVNPAAVDGYTLVYAVKEGSTVPTPAEAVKQWESGYEKLNYNLPPAFTMKEGEQEKPEEKPDEGNNGETGDNGEAGDKGETGDNGEAGDKTEGDNGKGDSTEEGTGKESQTAKTLTSKLGIYGDSAVSGFVSLMTDETRKMYCFKATGCTKAAIVCVLKEATLVEGKTPISEATWKKIATVNGVTKPTFTALESGANCLAEMNVIRGQEQLKFSPFVEGDIATKTKTLSSLMTSVTCQNLKAGTVKPTIGGETSLMFYSAAEPTCAFAVANWVLGSTSFQGELPPAYSSELDVYKKSAANNFVSLFAEGKDTQAVCYSAAGCEEQAIVCELKPAALKEGVKPLSKESWDKISSVYQMSAAAASFSFAAMLSSAALTLLAVALQL